MDSPSSCRKRHPSADIALLERKIDYQNFHQGFELPLDSVFSFAGALVLVGFSDVSENSGGKVFVPSI